MGRQGYDVFDHDTHGHATDLLGRVYYDDQAGRVVCSVHGDECATDGTMTRPATTAQQIGVSAEGIALFDHDNAKPTGDARLYRCSVCGQGTWTHLG